MIEFHGACQCGRVKVAFATANPEALQPRACQCSFCRRHGARTVADPNGSAVITAEPGALHRHQFGMRSADFLLCAHCGVYVGALAKIDGVEYITINAVGVDLADFAQRPAVPVVLDAETRGERDARRRRQWTPVTVRLADPARAVEAAENA